MLVRRIAELVKGQNKVTVRRDATVTEACQIMAAHDASALMVMDEIGLCGVLCQSDIIQRSQAHNAPMDQLRVDAIMTPEVQSVTPQASLADALRRMIAGGFRHLPVVDTAGELHGLVSIEDIPIEYRLMVERFSAYKSVCRAA